MAFNGTEGEEITLAEGETWTANYRSKMGANDPKAHFFGKDILNQILNQSGCQGIRMYYGIDDDNQKVLILAGATAEEDDMLALIADKGVLCPPRCGSPSPLNS